MRKDIRVRFLISIGAFLFALPFFISAISLGHGDQEDFYIDSDLDAFGREEISATIRHIGLRAYFYIENEWWDNIEVAERSEARQSLELLMEEFDNKIYPTLTSIYGFENRPGIDKNYRIAVLFHQMRKGVAGYFRAMDGYQRLQVPLSNEKEMVYLSTAHIQEDIIKSYLAHEFVHLITFNQKDIRLGKSEEVWLNELRAEHASTLLGYDDKHEGSNLQERIEIFIENSSDSLTEWRNRLRDYGVANIFAQYLVEHYGIEIFSKSMASPYVGIASINYALIQQGIEKDFSQIFTNWTIAVFLNNCTLSEKFCFREGPLSRIRVAPSLIFLPLTEQANLSLVYATKEWSGRWYKIIGERDLEGKGIEIGFESLSQINFAIPYLIKEYGRVKSINRLELDDDYRGLIRLPYFRRNNQSIVIIPSAQQSLSGFSDDEPFWRFSLNISTLENNQEEPAEEEEAGEERLISEMTIEELEARIIEITAQIKLLSVESANLKREEVLLVIPVDFNFAHNLRIGALGLDVKYLQIVLNSEMETRLVESGVGSPGQETSFFGNLTKTAVIRFQEKHAAETLDIWGLTHGTGFVGSTTRQKLNSLIRRH